LRWLGITPVLAERNTEHGSGLASISTVRSSPNRMRFYEKAMVRDLLPNQGIGVDRSAKPEAIR
jgi:hypothetical protein